MSGLKTKFGRLLALLAPAMLLLLSPAALASEADLVLPDLGTQLFMNALNGRSLLMIGLLVCLGGIGLGLMMMAQLKSIKVHHSMGDISHLIYETCKTYLVTQGKFILLLEVLVGAIMAIYFGWLRHLEPLKVVAILVMSLLGIAGSYGVAWFGIDRKSVV